ncbi:MAG: acyl-CoA dehydrogenase family protein [Phycisphaerales bacterium]|nr:acyl-CoA dehydrogenase family protein [Phycisphaerales bacterium]
MAHRRDFDFYRFDEELHDEERALQARVREWVATRFMPRVPACWEAHDFPMDLVPEMGELGCFGATIDGYGCPGLSSRAYGLVMRELERGDSGLRTMASVQGALAMNAIRFFGDESQRERWLPPMAGGEVLGCFGLTEPTHGSNPGGMLTTARRDGDGWILDGEKMWIGNADVSQVAVIWAKRDDLEGVDPSSPRAIAGFLVPTDLDGFEASLIENKMSLRIARTSRISLRGVRVSGEHLLAGADGLRGPLTCLDQARYGIAWGALGAAEACLAEALEHVVGREVFGQALASFQLVQDKLAGVLSRLVECTATTFRLAELKDAAAVSGEQISLAKYSNVEMAQEAARTCRELLGGVGILDDHAALRHMINLESVATYEGTRDIHRLVLGRWLTGIQAFQPPA